MIEIIISIIVFISLIALIFIIFNNKFQLLVIKFSKAEDDIYMYLQKKNDLLNRTRSIINKELKKKNVLKELDKPIDSYNNFELHNALKKIYNELFKTLDENEKLLKSESLVPILEELNDNEENIIGSIKYYNDTVVDFNHLIVAIPSSIVGFIKGYSKKSFYNNERREIFEILNNK